MTVPHILRGPRSFLYSSYSKFLCIYSSCLCGFPSAFSIFLLPPKNMLVFELVSGKDGWCRMHVHHTNLYGNQAEVHVSRQKTFRSQETGKSLGNLHTKFTGPGKTWGAGKLTKSRSQYSKQEHIQLGNNAFTPFMCKWASLYIVRRATGSCSSHITSQTRKCALYLAWGAYSWQLSTFNWMDMYVCVCVYVNMWMSVCIVPYKGL